MAPNRPLWLLAALWLLASCSSPDPVNFFQADQYPERLSAWGLVRTQSGLPRVNPASTVYTLNTPLFTDYALKLRTVYLPDGGTAAYDPEDAFDLPTGSVISKTFFYARDEQGRLRLDVAWDDNPASLTGLDVELIETRLLVKQADGWDALPYIWRGEDAYLSITGALLELPLQGGEQLDYVVPSRNQCANCHASNHTSGEIQPLGVKARHLNRPSPEHGGNQLTALRDRGWLTGLPADAADIPRNALWTEHAPLQPDALEHRARSYLDINCGHCHNAHGAADTSGLLLDYQRHEPGALGICKPPIAAGRGSGGHLYSIVPGDADHSILSYRMATTDPGTMMPELGRSLVHQAGVELVSAWIDSMSGACR